MKKRRTLLLSCLLFACYALCWGQTWNMTATMTATLDNHVLTIQTTQSAEPMPDYLWAAAPWYALHESIRSVVIENGVTTIGNLTFLDCTQLTSIVIPNSVTSIGEFAFFQCYELQSIQLPEALITIKEYAFHNCTSLRTITVPASVTSIGLYAFASCPELTAIIVDDANPVFVSKEGVLFDKEMTALMVYPENKAGLEYVIPNTVKTIETAAFYKARFESVTIPASVTAIKDDAFWGCRYLTGTDIPNSVTLIGKKAFYACHSLTSVTIPASVKEIGSGAFALCSELTSIGVDAGNTVYISEAGVLYSKDKTVLHSFPAGISGVFTIPAGVTRIGDEAFSACDKLKSVTLPNSLKTIGIEVFIDCSSLQSVSIPNSVTAIESGAFRNCSSLTSVTLSNAIDTISANCFNGCSSLTSVIIPEAVTFIDSYAFFNCVKLANITLPKSLIKIGWGAFYSCIALESITLPDAVEYIDGHAFADCIILPSITIPRAVNTIIEFAFLNCAGLRDVTVEWDIPLKVDEKIFEYVNTSAATLHVPTGTKARYQTADVWKNFGTIAEYDYTSAETINPQPLKASTSNGLLHLSGLTPGHPLYIYALSGQLIYSSLAKSQSETIPLTWHGVCIVVAGEQRVKIRL